MATAPIQFSDLEFTPHPNWDGVQARADYPNGYGASVIKSPHSYGGDAGLYELAVFGPTGDLDYSTPITSDVEGWLTEDGVTALLVRIAGLHAKASA